MKLLMFAMVRAARERDARRTTTVQYEMQRVRRHTGNELYPVEDADPVDATAEPVPISEQTADLIC